MKKDVEQALESWFPHPRERVIEAVCYSLLLPSKRLRPLFCLEVCRAFSGDYRMAMPAAMALEMVHTYSLIHDDMPCMDNDDLRRGKPTNHKVFGEATALLAGSALLTSAFEVLAKASNKESIRLQWISELTVAAGAEGMVLGQQWDMEPQGQTNIQSLSQLHLKKTGALLAASVVMGAQASEQSVEVQTILREFAWDMGLAFQIRDDILDVVGGVEIGKPLKSDERNSKLTYVNLLGLEGAQLEAEKLLDRALTKLKAIDFKYDHYLFDLTRFVLSRKV